MISRTRAVEEGLTTLLELEQRLGARDRGGSDQSEDDDRCTQHGG
jgi:hypothetical protein